MLLNGLEGPEGLEKMQETCSFHPATIRCHNSSVVMSADKKTHVLSKIVVFTMIYKEHMVSLGVVNVFILRLYRFITR